MFNKIPFFYDFDDEYVRWKDIMVFVELLENETNKW